jgi:uncharacterized coiled-coil DUF342 family protein
MSDARVEMAAEFQRLLEEYDELLEELRGVTERGKEIQARCNEKGQRLGELRRYFEYLEKA